MVAAQLMICDSAIDVSFVFYGIGSCSVVVLLKLVLLLYDRVTLLDGS